MYLLCLTHQTLFLTTMHLMWVGGGNHKFMIYFISKNNFRAHKRINLITKMSISWGLLCSPIVNRDVSLGGCYNLEIK